MRKLRAVQGGAERIEEAKSPRLGPGGGVLYCEDCGVPQFDSRGGWTCINGHGGAEGITSADVRNKIDAALLKAVPHGSVMPDAKAAVGEQLAREFNQASREERASSARAAVFESANAPLEQPMPAPMTRIIEAHFNGVEGLEQEHKALEQALDSTGQKPGHQAHELERAETMSRRAMYLWIKFRQMTFEWEMDNRVLFAAMRNEAHKTLQAEKDQKVRNKQITDADVDTACASMFPDEWRAQETRRNRAKLTEKSLEHLVEAWSSKCRSLNTAVGRGR